MLARDTWTMYEGSTSTRCGSAEGREMANTSTWSPPTEAAIEPRSLVEAPTRSLAAAVPAPAASSAARQVKTSRTRLMTELLELMGLVRPHGIDDAHRDGVGPLRILGHALGAAGHEMVPVEAERGGLLHQRQPDEGAERLIPRLVGGGLLETFVEEPAVPARVQVVVRVRVAARRLHLGGGVRGRR